MSEVFIFEYVGVSGRFSDVGVSGSVDYLVPESVSEGSFVNLGLMMLSAMCALILNFSFIAPVPQNGFLAGTGGPFSKVTGFSMVWRARVAQSILFTTPARRLIQK